MKRIELAMSLVLFIATVLFTSPIPTAKSEEKEPVYAALNPRGLEPEIKLIPPSSRVPDLNGKVVYCVSQGPGEERAFLEKVAEQLPKYAPGVKVVFVKKPGVYMSDDPELWDEIAKKANAVIYGCVASTSGSMFGGHWVIGLEKRGIPSVYMVYKPWVENVQITCEKEGMLALRRVIVGLRPEEELPQIMPKLIEALTKPLSEEEKKTGTVAKEKPPRIAVTGTLDEVQQYFNEHLWTDGLPIVPPTEKRVKEMLKGTSHAPNKVVTTTMWPESWTATVEKVAINGVMAGCKPADMPVLLAIIEAFGKGPFASGVRSTNGFSFPILVNGPIAKEIGMNSGINALGSSTGNRTNATIGRFLRLAIINLGSSISGVNDMSTIGNPSKYSFAFAEAEERSPWEPFHVSMGFKRDENVVTILSGGWSHSGNFTDMNLDIIAKSIARFEWPNAAVIFMDPRVAKTLAEKGYTKQAVEEYIWSHATLTMAEFKACNVGYYEMFIVPILKGKEMYGEKYLWPARYLNLPDDAVVQVYPRKKIWVMVVGGESDTYTQAWKLAYPTMVSVDKWK